MITLKQLTYLTNIILAKNGDGKIYLDCKSDDDNYLKDVQISDDGSLILRNYDPLSFKHHVPDNAIYTFIIADDD